MVVSLILFSVNFNLILAYIFSCFTSKFVFYGFLIVIQGSQDFNFC